MTRFLLLKSVQRAEYVVRCKQQNVFYKTPERSTINICTRVCSNINTLEWFAIFILELIKTQRIKPLQKPCMIQPCSTLDQNRSWPDQKTIKIENYTAKVGQDNVNIGVVTIFRLVNTSLLQVYWMDKCLLQDLYICRKWPK